MLHFITLLQVAKRLDTGWYWIHCPRLEMLQVARGPNIFNLRGKHIFGTMWVKINSVHCALRAQHLEKGVFL